MLSGYVCLVGAGPGDPGLITRLGLGYLRRADVVLYDRLVPLQLLLETRSGCERIDVGKTCGKPSLAQKDINQLLIAKAKSGKFVVRLKGGDPFLFGRGGEEAEALVQAGIPYIMVPGISSSLSVPASAGIPLTHRQVAHQVTIRTGHRGESGVAEGRPTQVVLMSLTSLAEISDLLIGEGYPPTAPAVVISRGATPFQRTISGTLQNIAKLAQEADLPSPALLVAGEAASLAHHLNWKQNLPLNGKRILWTRPETKDDGSCLEDLELLGAEVIRLPVFTVNPLPWVALLLPEIAQYSWLIFTSQNGVKIFCDAMLAENLDWRYYASSKIAVVGEKTAAALRRRGRNPELVDSGGNSQSLVNTLRGELRPGERVALCQAEKASSYLAEGLGRAGVDYHQFTLYHTECPEYPDDFIRNFFSDPFDVVVFTAPSAVVNYFNLLESHGLKPGATVRYPCLGPETAARLEQLGYSAWFTPEEPHLDQLIWDLTGRLRSEHNVSNNAFA